MTTAAAQHTSPVIFLGLTRSMSIPPGKPDKHTMHFGVLGNTNPKTAGYPDYTITQSIELAEDPFVSLARFEPAATEGRTAASR